VNVNCYFWDSGGVVIVFGGVAVALIAAGRWDGE